MNINPNAKRILCYGDSLTWGYRPNSNHERLPPNIRWTGQLQSLLGESSEIIEEGLNGRTLNSEDPRTGKEGRNGAKTLISILDTHDPIDLVLLMLGTNELKDAFDTSIEDIARIVEEKYVKVILNRESQYRGTSPSLLLISPPRIDLTKGYAKQRYSNSQDRCELLERYYEDIAKKNTCEFLKSSDIVIPGEDGVHIDEENHKKLAMAMSNIVETFFI